MQNLYHHILTSQFCATEFLSPTVSNFELYVHLFMLSINNDVAVPFQKEAILKSEVFSRSQCKQFFP